MKKWFLLILVLTALVIGSKAQGNEDVHLLKPEEFKKKIEIFKNEQLLDVRRADEYAKGAIKGSLNFDFFSKEFSNQIATLDKSKPVMVYCAGGYRSGETAKKLAAMGFKEIYDLEGGFDVYSAKGLDK